MKAHIKSDAFPLGAPAKPPSLQQSVEGAVAHGMKTFRSYEGRLEAGVEAAIIAALAHYSNALGMFDGLTRESRP